MSCLQAYGVVNAENRNTSSNRRQKKGANDLKVDKWIVDHDPEEYAQEHYAAALAHVKDSATFRNSNTPPGLVYKPWTIDGLLEAKERGEPTILDADWS